LTEAGLEVVRVTRSSISIADPNGGKNIRLKGAFYEQSFTDGRDSGVSFVAVFCLYCQIALIPLNFCFPAPVPVFFASESMK
ncbi:hypothetical protein, partial [Escherichia coli]|uniref:hypothetical protein n=2 Tax=Escherichia coli TaxID=562 RepID=UPI001FA6B99C